MYYTKHKRKTLTGVSINKAQKCFIVTLMAAFRKDHTQVEKKLGT